MNELDNRASNFYVCLYWAELMAERDPAFRAVATRLKDARGQVVSEFKLAQGRAVDIGGYYKFDEKKCAVELRPSPTFNKILDGDW